MGISMTSSIFVLGIFSIVSTHGRFLDRHFCEEKAGPCRRPLWTMLETSQATGQMPELDVICQAATNDKRCLGRCRSFIMTPRYEVRALNGVLDYVCAEDNREKMTELMGAECFRDGSVLRTFERKAKRCLKLKLEDELVFAIYRAQSRGIQPNDDNMPFIACPLVRDVMDCIDEKVEEMCGQSVVPSVKQIYSIVLREKLPSDLRVCVN